jgi:hypothetical protein
MDYEMQMLDPAYLQQLMQMQDTQRRDAIIQELLRRNPQQGVTPGAPGWDFAPEAPQEPMMRLEAPGTMMAGNSYTGAAGPGMGAMTLGVSPDAVFNDTFSAIPAIPPEDSGRFYRDAADNRRMMYQMSRPRLPRP